MRAGCCLRRWIHSDDAAEASWVAPDVRIVIDIDDASTGGDAERMSGRVRRHDPKVDGEDADASGLICGRGLAVDHAAAGVDRPRRGRLVPRQGYQREQGLGRWVVDQV